MKKAAPPIAEKQPTPPPAYESSRPFALTDAMRIRMWAMDTIIRAAGVMRDGPRTGQEITAESLKLEEWVKEAK